MKKSVKVLLLAIAVLALFVSCHDCAVCGKSKLNTEKRTVLGHEYYVCKDCADAPADAWNNVKEGVSSAAKDVKKGVDAAAKDIGDIFKK